MDNLIGCDNYKRLYNEFDGAITFPNGTPTLLYYHIIYCDECDEIRDKYLNRETNLIQVK